MEIKQICVKQVNKLDPYWSGKIVGECVRGFEKTKIKPFIEEKTYDFIEMQFNTLKIFYQKDIIEKHLKEIICNVIENLKYMKEIKDS